MDQMQAMFESLGPVPGGLPPKAESSGEQCTHGGPGTSFLQEEWVGGCHRGLPTCCTPLASAWALHDVTARLTSVSLTPTDVLASAVPQLQVPKRLREGGQPRALL